MPTHHIRDVPAVPTYQARPLEEATIATSPDAVSDDVFVILDAGSSQQRVGPVLGWQPHQVAGDEVLPVRGDRCLVARADTGYWLLAWEAQA